MDDHNAELLSELYKLAHGNKSWSFNALRAAFTRTHKRIPTPSSPYKQEGDIARPSFRTHQFTYKINRIVKNTEAYDFEYPRPKAVIVYISGWKGHPINPDEVNYLTALRGAGFAVVAMPIEDPGTNIIPLDGSANKVATLLTSLQSPLNTKYKDLPCAIMTHSTGGMVLQMALDRMDERHFRDDRIAINTATFFNPANASDHYPLRKWAYQNLHAKWHQNAHTGDAGFDRLYYYLSGIGKRLSIMGNAPTHGQVLKLTQEGSDLMQYTKRRIARRAGLPVARMKQIFVISKNDSFTCLKTSEEYANIIGAQTMFVQAEHNPLMNSTIRQQIIDKIDRELGRFYPSSAIVPDYGTNTENYPSLFDKDPDKSMPHQADFGEGHNLNPA